MTAMTLSSPDFWTRLSRRYAAQPVADPSAYEATLTRTLSYLHADDTVLELGAGTSSTALKLAPHVARYVSSDYAPGMVEIGREKAWQAAIPGLEVVEGTLGDASLGTGPYDTVLAFNLLHLLPDVRHAARGVAGLLRPGGLFISKSPCLAGNFGLFRVMIGAMRLVGKAPYVNLFTPAQLDAQIRAAGFELLESVDTPKGGRMRTIVARKL